MPLSCLLLQRKQPSWPCSINCGSSNFQAAERNLLIISVLKCCQPGLFLSPKKGAFFLWGSLIPTRFTLVHTFSGKRTIPSFYSVIFLILISTLIKTNKKQNYEQIFADHILANISKYLTVSPNVYADIQL